MNRAEALQDKTETCNSTMPPEESPLPPFPFTPSNHDSIRRVNVRRDGILIGKLMISTKTEPFRSSERSDNNDRIAAASHSSVPFFHPPYRTMTHNIECYAFITGGTHGMLRRPTVDSTIAFSKIFEHFDIKEINCRHLATVAVLFNVKNESVKSKINNV